MERENGQKSHRTGKFYSITLTYMIKVLEILKMFIYRDNVPPRPQGQRSEPENHGVSLKFSLFYKTSYSLPIIFIYFN
jgi:hypothetical protein